jgi:hypothetical protein
MLLDDEIANCTRRCAATGRALEPGQEYYSTLTMERGAPVRCDYSPEAWQGPPDGALAWWRSFLAEGDRPRGELAPQDVLLNLFAALTGAPGEQEFRYVLGLLLMRRRWLRLDDTRREAGGEVLVLDCPRRQEQFELRVAAPSAERQAELERRLTELVYGGAG